MFAAKATLSVLIPQLCQDMTTNPGSHDVYDLSVSSTFYYKLQSHFKLGTLYNTDYIRQISLTPIMQIIKILPENVKKFMYRNNLVNAHMCLHSLIN